MATVIDALVVELGLDPAKMAVGSRKAVDDLRKMEEEFGRRGKLIESRADNVSLFMSKLRGQVLLLYGAFTAGKGITQFIGDIVRTTPAMARLGYQLDISVRELSSWRNVSEQFGGSADEMSGSLQGLTQSIAMFRLTGEQADFMKWLVPLKIGLYDSSGNIKSATEIFLQAADAAQRMGMSPALMATHLQGLGANQSMLNFLMQGTDASRRAALATQAANAPTQADIDATMELQKAWADLAQTSTKLGTSLLTDIVPALRAVNGLLKDFLEHLRKNPEHARLLAGAITVLAGVLSLGLVKSLFAATLGLFRFGAAATVAGGAAATARTSILSLVNLRAGAGLAGAAIAVQAYADKITGSPEGRSRENEARAYVRSKGYTALAEWDEMVSGAFDWMMGRTGKTASAPRHFSPGGGGGSDIDKLVAMGWTREQAAGIAANIQRESQGNHQAVGDGGRAYGIAQWHPDRQANFKRWAGKDIRQSTRDEQLAFFNYELRQGSERAAGFKLMAARTAYDAGAIVSRYHERPADAEGEALRRGTLAANMMRPARVPRVVTAGLGLASTVNNRTSTSTSDTKIGTINIQTQATDAPGIAKSIKPALANTLAAQANAGAM